MEIKKEISGYMYSQQLVGRVLKAKQEKLWFSDSFPQLTCKNILLLFSFTTNTRINNGSKEAYQ